MSRLSFSNNGRTIMIAFIIVITNLILASQLSSAFSFGANSRPQKLFPSLNHNVPIHQKAMTKKALRYQIQSEGSIDHKKYNLSSLCTSEAQSNSNINRYAAGDWLHNVFTLPRSSVLREIRNPVMTIALWSQLVAVVHWMLKSNSSKLCQNICRNMSIGALPHSLLVSSLGLLLVFRTNSAYQRFAEGRKIWEQIHSGSRNICRFMRIYSNEIGYQPELRVRKLLAAFPYLLRHHIRPRCLSPTDTSMVGEHGLKLTVHPNTVVDARYEGDEVTMEQVASSGNCYVDRRLVPWNLFSSNEMKGLSLERVANAENRPLWACDQLAKEIAKIPYGPNFTSRERLTLVGHVEKLSNSVGECERIHQTAVPLNYARHSLRSLTIWLFSLPFVLVKDLGLLTGVAMGIISWLLFGVYQIGYSIEDPFQGTLRLSILCDAIKKDVLDDSLFDVNMNIHNKSKQSYNEDAELLAKQMKQKLSQDLLITQNLR